MTPIFITCAITGNHTTRQQNPALPITPAEIAESAISAHKAGAAIVHIHVRDPETGAPSMSVNLYAEVMERIRDRAPDVLINLTTGPGGRFQPSEHDPVIPGPRTNLLAPQRRVEHIAALRPDIATLDLNTMISGREVVINTPENLRRMASIIRLAGVIPELELFDSGDIALANDLISDGTLPANPLCSIVMGVKYGFQPSPETVLYARNLLPTGAVWTAFGIGRGMFTMAAQSVLLGGNVRVGFEDGVYLSRGELAKSNSDLVIKVRRIAEDLGAEILSAAQVRARISDQQTK